MGACWNKKKMLLRVEKGAAFSRRGHEIAQESFSLYGCSRLNSWGYQGYNHVHLHLFMYLHVFSTVCWAERHCEAPDLCSFTSCSIINSAQMFTASQIPWRSNIRVLWTRL